MLPGNRLIKYCISCFIIILQTSYGKQNNPPLCVPSSCGEIRNISYPFRLSNDPKHCGVPKYQLACENNTTSLYLNSQKYIVRAINYHNHTIRLADAAMKNDVCSFPEQSLSPSNFRHDYPYSVKFPGDSRYKVEGPEITSSITFMSCAHQLNNSHLLETTARCVDRKNGGSFKRGAHYTYIKFGILNGSYLMDMCRIEVMVMTSFPLKEEENSSVSLSQIHTSLLYGFELSWFTALCPGNCKERCWFDGKRAKCRPLYFLEPCEGSVLCRFLDILYLIGAKILLLGIGFVFSLRFLIGISCLLGLVIYKLRRRHLSIFDVIEGFLQSNNLMPIRYSYSNIKKMTRGFREKIGEGGYGSVYRGKVRSGHDVAVKVLSKPRASGQDFINEVATIGRIHHVNVVKLVGYCAERSKRALVYEFMPNGSLDKYIFSQERINALSWEKKYEIAIGVARGIGYLHQGCDIHILHFDIKPHNILLDHNFTPKISDFGLAKFCSTENTTVTLTFARGTIGYVAPELINRTIGRVSYKADVYSFGMLLMEIVGLKRDIATDHDNKSSQYFPYWIYDRLNKDEDIEIENASNEIDGDDDTEYVRKITRKMTIVGLWCIQMSPNDRPSMSEVVKMLESTSDENLQIPPQPFQSPHNDQTWEIESTDSIALLGDDASSGYIE